MELLPLIFPVLICITICILYRIKKNNKRRYIIFALLIIFLYLVGIVYLLSPPDDGYNDILLIGYSAIMSIMGLVFLGVAIIIKVGSKKDNIRSNSFIIFIIVSINVIAFCYWFISKGIHMFY